MRKHGLSIALQQLAGRHQEIEGLLGILQERISGVQLARVYKGRLRARGVIRNRHSTTMGGR